MTQKVALYEVDLHCHTTASDGSLSPAELVRFAAELGLKGLGITDHDTIKGWDEAEEAAAHHNLQILKGIELSTDWLGKEVHILGYELDSSSNYLKDKLRNLGEARQRRMLKILECLRNQGVDISEKAIRNYAQGDSIGRPHIAQALMEKGYIQDIQEGFERYLGVGAPAYVPRYKLTPEEGIELIRKSKGVPVLAHPGLQRLEDGIPAWVEAGLKGIEVLHSEHKPRDVTRYKALAEHHNLLMTGGSDFHGEACKPGVELGRWGVSLKVLQEIKELARSN